VEVEVRVLFEDATVVTVDATDRVLEHAWVEVTDGVITAVATNPLDPAETDRAASTIAGARCGRRSASYQRASGRLKRSRAGLPR
jgi:hypothetical protein